MQGVAWTDERVTTLRELWSKVSALDISKQLNKITSDAGNVSRNAVIGKAQRLKLGPKVGGRLPKSQKAKQPPPPPPPPVAVAAVVVPFTEEVPLQPETRTFWTRKDDGDACRWPCGIQPLNDGYFCGAPAMKNRSYCEEHFRQAYVLKKGTPNAAKNILDWRVRTSTRWV